MSRASDEALEARLASRAADRESRPLRAALQLLQALAFRVLAWAVGLPLYFMALSEAVFRFGPGPVTVVAWVAVIGAVSGLVATQVRARRCASRRRIET